MTLKRGNVVCVQDSGNDWRAASLQAIRGLGGCWWFRAKGVGFRGSGFGLTV